MLDPVSWEHLTNKMENEHHRNGQAAQPVQRWLMATQLERRVDPC